MKELINRRDFIKGFIAVGASTGAVAIVSSLSGCSGLPGDPGADIYANNGTFYTSLTLNGSTITSWTAASNITTVDIYVNDHTLSAVNRMVICNKTTPMTITLPAANGSKRLYEIKNIGIGAVVVDGNGADTIDGDLTQTLGQHEAISIVDYAANKWSIY
jgi:hypothetical protein